MADTGIMKQIADKIKDSNNILVTVNANPSVDELSAALGITLLINKLNKHATAVFSGAVPPAIEFLNPEKTFENTVDSLRDFIIALDKEKADHLRYKVVDDMVKIFITPYRTTLSESDLDFSQGDYNVEMVLAIGVKTEADLDHALESHGRIMHDASVAAVTLGEPTSLGGIEWADSTAGSYAEMLMGLAEQLRTDKATIDEQIATAFLTGIVAATDRFSNSKTTSRVMTIAAELMSAGANQQLIATQLQKEQEISPEKISKSEASVADDKTAEKSSDDAIGALSISHVPEGTVDEVTKQVNDERSNEALGEATQQLTESAQPSVVTNAIDPTEAEEQKLAQQLNEVPGIAIVPPQVGPLRGPVSMDQWKRSDDADTAAEPSFGGTLNATTEQAADDARKVIEDDRNRTILTHGGGSYVADAPSFQAPLNATSLPDNSEPNVQDFLSTSPQDELTSHIDAIQPPAPVAHEPTLAEIDAKNRAHQDVLSALDSPVVAPSVQPSANGLPPLPPMPDFSTLPPLPPELGMPAPLSDPTPAPGQPIPPAAPTQSPTDPAAFRIPGQ